MRPRAIRARRGAHIEWFSGCSNHGGAIFTRPGFRSQASCQLSRCDITLGTRRTLVRPLLSSLPSSTPARTGVARQVASDGRSRTTSATFSTPCRDRTDSYRIVGPSAVQRARQNGDLYRDRAESHDRHARCRNTQNHADEFHCSRCYSVRF
jgi:hypothetical protein